MYPVYGLAEASLAVSFPPLGAPLKTITLNRHRMGLGSDPVEAVAAGDRDAVQFVSEGRAIPGCRLRITDEEDREVAEDRIGHVQITGDNVTRGYFEDPPANAAAFTADGWLRTGDLGPDPRRGSLHLRARQGDHFRQRPELLPARPGGDRAARTRS